MGCPSRPRCPGGGLDLTPQGRIHFRGLLGEPVPPALQLLAGSLAWLVGGVVVVLAGVLYATGASSLAPWSRSRST